MENKYLLVVLVAIVASVFVISVASAHSNSVNQLMNNEMGMGSMMGMNGMMDGNFAHDMESMREEMKEHMGFTDEEFNEMAEHCPMMQRK